MYSDPSDGSLAHPAGNENVASEALPFLAPRSPVPQNVVTTPVGVILRTRSLSLAGGKGWGWGRGGGGEARGRGKRAHTSWHSAPLQVTCRTRRGCRWRRCTCHTASRTWPPAPG